MLFRLVALFCDGPKRDFKRICRPLTRSPTLHAVFYFYYFFCIYALGTGGVPSVFFEGLDRKGDVFLSYFPD